MRTQLSGSLLIAVPRLKDPNFERTVILMIRHGAGGALGIVLGESVEVPMEELCEAFEIKWTRPEALPLRRGGPCDADRLWILYGGSEPLPGSETVAPGIHLGSSITAIIAALQEQPQVPMALFAGYAGWGPGQLEVELGQNSWMPGDVTAELVFSVSPDEVWDAAYREMSLVPGMITSGKGASA